MGFALALDNGVSQFTVSQRPLAEFNVTSTGLPSSEEGIIFDKENFPTEMVGSFSNYIICPFLLIHFNFLFSYIERCFPFSYKNIHIQRHLHIS